MWSERLVWVVYGVIFVVMVVEVSSLPSTCVTNPIPTILEFNLKPRCERTVCC